MKSPSAIQFHAHVTGTAPALHHLTAVVMGPTADATEVYAEALEYLVERGLSVAQEKAFVAPAAAAAFADARRASWSAHGLEPRSPRTTVLDPPSLETPVAGVQLLATDATVRPVTHDGAVVGLCLAADELAMLFAAELHGLDAGPGAADQMTAMFQRAGDLTSASGYAFDQVARTWLYVHPLLEHYDALNATRDRFFRGLGLLTDDGPRYLPASTGIQGAHPHDARAFMDLVAVRGAPVQPMRTSHQCEASDYGSAFARGMVVDLPDSQLLYASGTASIDDRGRTVHVGDSRGQVLETYAAIETLLGLQDSGWRDVVTGVSFCKDEATWQTWLDLRREGAIPDLPLIPVQADVCRDDLLYELEVTAAR